MGLFRKIFENEGAGVYSYQVLEVEYPDQIISVAEKEGLEGINVTIPHKESTIPYLDRLDTKAKKINAVKNVSDLKKLLIEMETQGGIGFFGVNVGTDAKKSNRNVVSVGLGGLGLPDRLPFWLRCLVSDTGKWSVECGYGGSWRV